MVKIFFSPTLLPVNSSTLLPIHPFTRPPACPPTSGGLPLSSVGLHRINQRIKEDLPTTGRPAYDRKTCLRQEDLSKAGKPLEIEYIDLMKPDQIDLTDLFMEGYFLYRDGYDYSFKSSDNDALKHLSEDYVQKSDVDLLLEEYIQSPENENDIWLISNLDIVLSIKNKYPHIGNHINAVMVGKLMNERGYATIRKGIKRIPCYAISLKSKVTFHTVQQWAINGTEW